jgi:3-methyladenine DNA glycosylase AlkD
MRQTFEVMGFVNRLRDALATQADAQQAGPMQAYMKSALPFLGIAAPVRRKLTFDVVKAQPLATTAELSQAMLQLWRQARFREERYAASELARLGAHKKLLNLDLLPVFEEMIVSGAWWDHCDEISGNGIQTLLQTWPAQMKPVLRQWAKGKELWLRRTAMLCQRGIAVKDGFDAVLLYDCILPSIGNGNGKFANEFFIRKGMGWALRERSYAAPEEVQAFCTEYAHALSPLTVREALKVLAKRKELAGGSSLARMLAKLDQRGPAATPTGLEQTHEDQR